MFFYQMSLPLSASSPNSTKMKYHSSLIYIVHTSDADIYKKMFLSTICDGQHTSNMRTATIGSAYSQDRTLRSELFYYHILAVSSYCWKSAYCIAPAVSSH